MRFLKDTLTNLSIWISILTVILVWVRSELKKLLAVSRGHEVGIKEKRDEPRGERASMREVTNKIYEHWANIDHPRLIDLAQDETYQFMEYVKQLAEGKIVGPAHKAFTMLINEVWEMKESLFASHVVRGWGDIKAWSQAPMGSYQESIKKMAQGDKKKEATRIFILSRTVAACPEMFLAVIKVMKQHKDDGMTLLVVWEDVVKDSSLIQNFVVIDKKVVEHGSEAGKCACNDWLLRESTLSYNEMEAQRYHRRFKHLSAYAKELDIWLAENGYHLPPDPRVKDETHTVN